MLKNEKTDIWGGGKSKLVKMIQNIFAFTLPHIKYIPVCKGIKPLTENRYQSLLV